MLYLNKSVQDFINGDIFILDIRNWQQICRLNHFERYG